MFLEKNPVSILCISIYCMYVSILLVSVAISLYSGIVCICRYPDVCQVFIDLYGDYTYRY